ncbi:hypothetical protein BDZ45DRAFT_679469 [Acephala macrosclerotiorum]|nr:hypothetical protein BDZ45DRAFT_679469 [Acephala macrosclerotiorum]
MPYLYSLPPSINGPVSYALVPHLPSLFINFALSTPPSTHHHKISLKSQISNKHALNYYPLTHHLLHS